MKQLFFATALIGSLSLNVAATIDAKELAYMAGQYKVVSSTCKPNVDKQYLFCHISSLTVALSTDRFGGGSLLIDHNEDFPKPIHAQDYSFCEDRAIHNLCEMSQVIGNAAEGIRYTKISMTPGSTHKSTFRLIPHGKDRLKYEVEIEYEKGLFAKESFVRSFELEKIK